MSNPIYEPIQKALQQQKSALYEVSHMQELRQVGEIAYQTQTKQVLSVSDFRVDVNSYSFVIELKKHEILSVYPDYREVAVFGQLFVVATT